MTNKTIIKRNTDVRVTGVFKEYIYQTNSNGNVSYVITVTDPRGNYENEEYIFKPWEQKLVVSKITDDIKQKIDELIKGDVYDFYASVYLKAGEAGLVRWGQYEIEFNVRNIIKNQYMTEKYKSQQ